MNYIYNSNTVQAEVIKINRFQHFTFIGNISNKFISTVTEQLNLSPNNKLISQAMVEDCLKIIELHTDQKTSDQLKNFKIEPGAIIKLVSKTHKGSVIVSLGNELIGMDAEIARQIVATPAN